MFRNDKKTKGNVDLSDVIKGMQNAVNEAQKTLEMHNLNSLQSFFFEDGEPKTLELHLAEDNYIEVPILSLASHNSLMIDRLSMEFDAKIEKVGINNAEDVINAISREDGNFEDVEENSDRRAVFGIGFSGDPESNSVKVKIEFCAAKRAEGLSRVLYEYNKLIVPYKEIEGENNSTWKKHDSAVGVKRGQKK